MSSQLKVNSIQDKTGTRVLASDSGSAWSWGSGLPSGSIAQIQYTQYSSQCQMTGIAVDTVYVVCDGTAGSGTEILNVTITPKITNSKFLLEAQWMGEFDVYQQQQNHTFSFLRGSTHLAQSGNAGGVQVGWPAYPASGDNANTPNGVFLRYFDAPSISAGTATTYKLAYRQYYGSGATLNINRCVDNQDSSGHERGISSISVTEIAP